jgi:hypothetical protein
MALAQVKEGGLESWLGTALSTALLGDVTPLQNMITSGLAELESLFTHYGVK